MMKIAPKDTPKTEFVYGRQIAFAAAFLLPASKLLEAPSILAEYAAGDLLLPALLHFFLQFLVLSVVVYAVCRSKIPLIDRLQRALGKFLPIFYILYALYFLFSAVLPLFDLEKYTYAAFFDTEPTVFSFGFFFILSAFICTKGIKAVGRCADICLFLFPVAFFALIAMSLSEADFSNLLPLFGSRFADISKGFWRATPHFSDVVMLLPLFCVYQPKKEDGKKILCGYAFGAFCTLLLLGVFYGAFSSLAPREHYAFSKIAQYFPALSVLGRIDLLFVYLLSIVLLFYTSLPLQYSVHLFTNLFKKPDLRIWIAFIFNLSLFLFLLFGNQYYNSVYRWISGYLPVVFYFIADMVPLFLIFLPDYSKKTDLSNAENLPQKSIKKGEIQNA